MQKIHLRLATEADVAGPVIEAARDLAKRFPHLKYDEDTTLDNFFLVIDQPNQKECMMVVAEDEKGNFRGVIAGVLVKIPYNSDSYANEMLFWTDGTPKVFKALHRAYTDWAEGVGAKSMFISAPVGKHSPERWDQFYKTLGYSMYEHRFVKEVN